jgi:hypothetical protein
MQATAKLHTNDNTCPRSIILPLLLPKMRECYKVLRFLQEGERHTGELGLGD